MNVVVGSPPTLPCCSLIQGLVDLDSRGRAVEGILLLDSLVEQHLIDQISDLVSVIINACQ
ncbi:hypothetical protein H5410_016435 [Solanum commersonii]|uniref:Uncharacterized protein n=1 Tax=Solanum commersonii TaxID=4109 RepID=A0A9J5ZX02_SOLCO|nr:hypothetical protein H5410_016435 [Solanum commersonii]